MNHDVMSPNVRTRLQIYDDPPDKQICYHPLRLKTVVSPSSIRALRKRAQNRNFHWMTDDGSLTVQGQDNRWSLAFRMVTPPYSVVTVLLSSHETDTVKRGLLIE